VLDKMNEDVDASKAAVNTVHLTRSFYTLTRARNEARRGEAKILKSWTRRSEARRKLVEAKRSDLKSATSADLTFRLF